MNYEKKYKEALERAQQAVDKGQVSQNFVDDIFPEHKESEDERIRNGLINGFKECLKECQYPKNAVKYWHNVEVDSILAWLEKQESYYTFEIKEGHWYKCVCDYMLNGSDLMFNNDSLYYCRRNWRLTGEIDERNVKDIGVNGYKSFFRPATNQEIKDWLKKQGEQHSSIDINKMVNEFAHTEVNDYGIPSMIEVDAYRKGIEDVLEKQGEKKGD